MVQAQVVTVETEINVEQAVVVIIGDGRVGESSLGWARELEGIALEQKLSFPLVQQEQRTAGANHEKVLHSLVLEIREEGAGRVVQHVHSGLLRHILEGSVAAIAIQAVGKPGGLANVQVVEAVVVDVSRRHAVVAIDIDPAGSVQNGAPVVNSTEHLIFVRVGMA